MPVTVMPKRAAKRVGRRIRPSRFGFRASWAAVTPLRMLLWMVKKLSTRRTRFAIGVPASVPTACAFGVPLTRIAIHTCTRMAAATSRAIRKFQLRATRTVIRSAFPFGRWQPHPSDGAGSPRQTQGSFRNTGRGEHQRRAQSSAATSRHGEEGERPVGRAPQAVAVDPTAVTLEQEPERFPVPVVRPAPQDPIGSLAHLPVTGPHRRCEFPVFAGSLDYFVIEIGVPSGA